MLSEVNEQLQRLETLRLVDVNECDLHWQKFVQHPNLINYCFKFFESVNMQTNKLSALNDL